MKLKTNTSELKDLLKNVKTQDCCGSLSLPSGEKYILLYPYPLTRESWQADNQQRFLVVPDEIVGQDEELNAPIYSYPRHLVTTNFSIEYKYVYTSILVIDLGSYSVESSEFTEMEEPPSPKELLGTLIENVSLELQDLMDIADKSIE